LSQGQPFASVFDTVLGAEVAQRLHYRVGDHIVLSHGMGGMHLNDHADKPFVVTGILARTGTLWIAPSISDWMACKPFIWIGKVARACRSVDFCGAGQEIRLDPENRHGRSGRIENRAQVFRLQRDIADDTTEPLMAVLPGVALDELWQVGRGWRRMPCWWCRRWWWWSASPGLVSSILASLGERRRELAILRSVGARPRDVFLLLALEGMSVMLAGVLLGLLLLTLALFALGPMLSAQFGVTLHPTLPAPAEIQLLLWIIFAGFIASLLPGMRAYRLSLADGLTPRL